MNRREIIASSATLIGLSTAGCLGSGDSDDDPPDDAVEGVTLDDVDTETASAAVVGYLEAVLAEKEATAETLLHPDSPVDEVADIEAFQGWDATVEVTDDETLERDFSGTDLENMGLDLRNLSHDQFATITEGESVALLEVTFQITYEDEERSPEEKTGTHIAATDGDHWLYLDKTATVVTV